MASLSDLSEELLNAVASRISASGDLFNFVLASKQLHRIATPHLYAHVPLTLGESNREHKKLCEFALKVLDRPKLLALVRHLEIRGEWADDDSSEVRVPSLSEAYPHLVPEIVALVPYGADLVDGYSSELVLFVLLHNVPNLRTLEMPHSAFWQRLTWQMYEHTVLLNLEELAFTHSFGSPPWNVFAKRPKLKSVFIFNLRETYHYTDDIPADFGDSSGSEDDSLYLRHAKTFVDYHRKKREVHDDLYPTEHLEFRYARTDFPSVLRRIARCRTLRSFAFEFDPEWREYRCFFNAIAQALTIHATTLTALCIEDVSLLDYHAIESRRSLGLQTSLRGLVNLKYLKIPVAGYVFEPRFQAPNSWCKHDVAGRFPPSIQELTLTFTRSEESGDIRALEPYLGPSILPNLKVLNIHCHSPEMMYSGLHKFTERHGIRLRLFRKLHVSGDRRLITPFVKSCGMFSHYLSEVEVKLPLPASVSTLEAYMAVEEYHLDENIIVTSSGNH